MDKLITIYHSSEKIVEHPLFGEGRKNNDFGLGFYCTENEHLAKEWAVSSLHNGFSRLKYEGFDYAVNTCNITGSDFIKMFVASSICKRMENGEPAYLAGKKRQTTTMQSAGYCFSSLCLRAA